MFNRGFQTCEAPKSEMTQQMHEGSWTLLDRSTAAAKAKDGKAQHPENLAKSRKKIPHLPKSIKFLVQQNPTQQSSSSSLGYLEQRVKYSCHGRHTVLSSQCSEPHQDMLWTTLGCYPTASTLFCWRNQDKQLPHLRKALNSPFPFSILSLLSSYSLSFPLSNPAPNLLTRHLQRSLSQQSHVDPACAWCPPAMLCRHSWQSSSHTSDSEFFLMREGEVKWNSMERDDYKGTFSSFLGFIGITIDMCCILRRKLSRLQGQSDQSWGRGRAGRMWLPLLGSDQNQCSPHGKGERTCRAQFTLQLNFCKKDLIPEGCHRHNSAHLLFNCAL